jgi:hypothetical protein
MVDKIKAGDLHSAITAAPVAVEDPVQWLKDNAQPMKSGETYLTTGFHGGLTEPTITEFDVDSPSDLGDIIAAAVKQTGKQAGKLFYYQLNGKKVVVAFNAGTIKLVAGKVSEPDEGIALYLAK